MEIIKITKNDEGQRLDSFLKKIMPNSPGGVIYKYIRTNKIKLNSKKPKPEVRLVEGDEIKYFGDSAFLKTKTFTPAAYTLDVLYEDENILVVNKPRNMASQPDATHKSATLVDNIKNYLYQKGEYTPESENSFSPALCNRIDYNTCGICIAGKNAESLRLLNEKVKSREIRRFYTCVTLGVPKPESGVIKGQILKKAAENKSYVVKSGGKDAETHYKVLKTDGKNALCEVEIISGRSHQVRAHMSSIGYPLCGDFKYGAKEGSGQYLMANKVLFEFKTDAGILNYLRDKTVEAPHNFDLSKIKSRNF